MYICLYIEYLGLSVIYLLSVQGELNIRLSYMRANDWLGREFKIYGKDRKRKIGIKNYLNDNKNSCHTTFNFIDYKQQQKIMINKFIRIDIFVFHFFIKNTEWRFLQWFIWFFFKSIVEMKLPFLRRISIFFICMDFRKTRTQFFIRYLNSSFCVNEFFTFWSQLNPYHLSVELFVGVPKRQ